MKSTQLTDTLVMVRPDTFGFNAETAQSNTFQHTGESLGLSGPRITGQALREFALMQELLTRRGITVLTLASPAGLITPDAVFPNNWFSHHADGALIIYPMLTPNRRLERQPAALSTLLRKHGILALPTDITDWETAGLILEGTGSLVLDREHSIAYALESPRTTNEAARRWAELFGYTLIFMHAYDRKHIPIYHTNVLMNIGATFAVVCLEAIDNAEERNIMATTLARGGKSVITISRAQLHAFCGNLLHVRDGRGNRFIVLSTTAYAAFTQEQLRHLSGHGELLPVDISTIESIGGGSARCMLAEVFPAV